MHPLLLRTRIPWLEVVVVVVLVTAMRLLTLYFPEHAQALDDVEEAVILMAYLKGVARQRARRPKGTMK